MATIRRLLCLSILSLYILFLSPGPARAAEPQSLDPDQSRHQGDEALMRGEPVLALQWYRSAAERGDTTAQTRLGWLYRNGNGVPLDFGQALHWFTLAARGGNSAGEFSLGTLHEHGRGVPKDPAEAARWYRQAAAKGHAGAQNNLGWLYQNGQGVPQDFAEAARWYQLAAEQGQPDAIGNLGLLYLDGRGVPRNPAEGERLLRLAAAQGDKEAAVLVARIEDDRRRRVATRMAVEPPSPRLIGVWRSLGPLVDQGLRRMYLTMDIRRGTIVFQYDCRFLDGSMLIGSFSTRAELQDDGIRVIDGGRSVAANAENTCSAGVQPSVLPYRLDAEGLSVTFGARTVRMVRASPS